jgi:phage-related protein
VIHVLHCFEKRSRQTPRKEINLARQRLKAVRARVIEEKKHGGRTQ